MQSVSLSLEQSREQRKSALNFVGMAQITHLKTTVLISSWFSFNLLN